MSLNKFMHPRNVYRIPPNFKELAIHFPEFRQFAKQDLSGKIRIDFKDANALRALTRTLLIKDFNLEVEIPPDRLVPTLPLRLNYLLWLEDLVKQNGFSYETIKGIDIGTGASCIYPLLAAKHFKWQMLGTEIDSKSFDIAKKNVDKNQLQHLITLKKIDCDNVLSNVIDADVVYTFCMCNPPFFSNEDELLPESVSRNANRSRPRNAASGSISELVVPGGECVFIKKIIDDSKELKSQIRFYTVMVGHKSSINTVKEYLKESGITNIKTTEFCQGRTTRWGIAWTHCPGIILFTDSPTNSVKKNKTPLTFTLSTSLSLSEVVCKTKEILTELQINVKILKINNEFCAMEITAETNTWSNQRRKRRLKQLQQLKSNTETSEPSPHSVQIEQIKNVDAQQSSEEKPLCQENVKSDIDESCLGKLPASSVELLDKYSSENCAKFITEQKCGDILDAADDRSKNSKRPIEIDGNEVLVKRIKLESENSDVIKTNNNGPLLVGSLVVRIVSKTILFELFYLRGTGGRDSGHQILQYLKNKCML